MLKLKFRYFGHLWQRADSLQKTPDAGKDWMQKEKGTTEAEMVRWLPWLNGNEFEQTPGDSGGWWSPVPAVHGVAKSQTQLSNWTIRNTRHNGIFYVLICIVKLSEIKKVKFYEEIYIIECFKKNIFSWRQVRWYFFVNLFSSGFTQAMILSYFFKTVI